MPDNPNNAPNNAAKNTAGVSKAGFPKTGSAKSDASRSASLAPRSKLLSGKSTAFGLGPGRSIWTFKGLSHAVSGVLAILSGTAVALNTPICSFLEYQLQSLYFEARGPIPAPDNIVILAIDESSFSQAQAYRDDPKKYAYLKPLQNWPWSRSAYAEVINKLMAAKARAIGIDVVFSSSSSDPLADLELQQVLRRYGSRVTLAALYEDVETHQGKLTQLTLPDAQFRVPDLSIGYINYAIEPNGKIYRLGGSFSAAQDPNDPLYQSESKVPTFAKAIVQSAEIEPKASGDHIFYHGPAGTFEQIPFWYVLDPENWNDYLRGGEYFRDKIVLIGATAITLRDFHAAPFSMSWFYPTPMAGVEIHANAVANLLENQFIRDGLPDSNKRGWLVFVLVAGAAGIMVRFKRVVSRGLVALALSGICIGIGYYIFMEGQLILPVAVPAAMISLVGLSYVVIGSIDEYHRKLRLRRTLRNYASSPIVQEIISQQEDLQDLLLERERAILNQKLAGRYRVIKVLGAGGFGETYVAEDTQRPGNPKCVVKVLRPVSNELKLIQLAARFFEKEAETLERLGKHDQIPQLLAYFEEGHEFFLVQELIEGHPLSQELPLGRQLPEFKVVSMLQDLLGILEFVHSQGVIHRDIKPNNIIRRQSDGKLVLIDFGAVKEIRGDTVRATTTDPDSQNMEELQASQTIGIGTRGYIPVEQVRGRPRFNSDIYAVGMTAVRALTGLPPDRLNEDVSTGHIVWEKSARASGELTRIINKMIHYDFAQRYQSVEEVLQALKQLSHPHVQPSFSPELVALHNDEALIDETSITPVIEETAVAARQGALNHTNLAAFIGQALDQTAVAASSVDDGAEEESFIDETIFPEMEAGDASQEEGDVTSVAPQVGNPMGAPADSAQDDDLEEDETIVGM